MNRIALIVLIAAALAVAAWSQHHSFSPAAGERTAYWKNGFIDPGGDWRHGPSIWNNNAVSGWWSGID